MVAGEYFNFVELIPGTEEEPTSTSATKHYLFPGLGLIRPGHKVEYSFLQWFSSFMTYMAVLVGPIRSCTNYNSNKHNIQEGEASTHMLLTTQAWLLSRPQVSLMSASNSIIINLVINIHAYINISASQMNMPSLIVSRGSRNILHKSKVRSSRIRTLTINCTLLLILSPPPITLSPPTRVTIIMSTFATPMFRISLH